METSGEIRENVPLQGRKTRFFTCDEEYFGGLKFINFAFGSLTVIITIALLLQIYYGDYQIAPHGSVATDSLECSEVGTRILKNGGNSMDAAISSAFCLAVVTPHLTSLDGGGIIMIYNHRKRNNPDIYDFTYLNSTSLPRLVNGLGFLHQNYATFAWKDLIEPSIKLAKDGFLIPKMLVQAIHQSKVEDLYGRLEAGQFLQLGTLAKFLQDIANMPETDLYHRLTPPEKLNAFNFTRNNYKIYSTSQELEDFDTNSRTEQRFEIGVTTNIAVIDTDENYISFVMGLSKMFGSAETTTGGYIVDSSKTQCSRLPIIITSNRICGRRLVTGANSPSLAKQLIYDLLVEKNNVTEAIEAPRFHLFPNETIGIERFHSPQFSESVLKQFPEILYYPEPYPSINIVEKMGDDLYSHSDSRGGGIASRF